MNRDRPSAIGELRAAAGAAATLAGSLAVVELGVAAPPADLASPRVWAAQLLAHAFLAFGLAAAGAAAWALARPAARWVGRVGAAHWTIGLGVVVLGFAHGWPLVHEPLEAAFGRPLALTASAVALATAGWVVGRWSGGSPRRVGPPIVYGLALALGCYLLRAEPLGLPARSRLVAWGLTAGFALLGALALGRARRRGLAGLAGLLLLWCLVVRWAAPDPHGLIRAAATERGAAWEGPTPPVILIVADTLRADAVELDDPRSGATPALARLAAHGDVFTRVVANASWTLPAHASLLTGSRVSRHRVDLTSAPGFVSRLDPALATLHQRFAERGYATSCVTANGIVGPASELTRGCERLRHPGRTWMLQTAPLRLWYAVSPSARPALEEQLITSLTGLRRQATAREVLGFALAELDRATRPTYLFVNLMDVHRAYPAARETSAAENRAFLLDLLAVLGGWRDPEAFHREHAAWARRAYAEQVERLDGELGRFFEELRRRGLYEPALVVLTADHGEAFFDNPDLSRYYDHHGAYEPAVRIPLIVKRPGLEPGRRFERLVEQSDIAPAVLDLSAGRGAAGELYEPRGAAITEWNPHPRPGAMGTLPRARSGLYRGDLKLVLETEPEELGDVGAGRPFLFDLAASPFEAVEVAAERPEVAGRLAAELVELLARERASAPSAAPGSEAPDPELEKTLRALGYIE